MSGTQTPATSTSAQPWVQEHLLNVAGSNPAGVPPMTPQVSATTTNLTNSPDQEQGYQQAGTTNVAPTATATAGQANAPNPVNASTYDASQVNAQTPEMQAAQGTVDPRSLVTAEQEQVNRQDSTVQGQLQQIMDGDQRFAQGAVRRANEQMAARGMGASTMAADATTRAVIESALPIAQADANIFAQFQLANLNNRQQSALANAERYHAVNMANLSNTQQSNLVNTQARLQTLLSDQSADNAAKQFNAANQTQVDTFMANLETQVSQFNAAQATAVSQFNAGQTNATEQLRAQLAAQREQFNTTMRAQIDQSNVAWRRQINTINTAAANETNRINTQNTLNLSNWALNAVWQQFRDEADYAFTASENAQNRATNMAILASQQGFQSGLINQQQQSQMYQSLGNFSVNLLNNLMK